MIASRLARPFFDRFRGGINRAPWPPLAIGLPWLSILLASLCPILPVIASAPVLPPLGFMLFLAWRQVRPGLMPIWAGLPLGMFDDIYSGQPFGSAIFLWSASYIVLEVVDAQIRWGNFALDWLVSVGLISAYLLLSLAFANAAGASTPLHVLAPQAMISVFLFPLVGRLVARLDRLRLLPIADAG